MPEIDRNSKASARSVAEKLLPDENTRRLVLTSLADAIRTGNQQGPAKWGVTLYSGSIALNISGFYACWIKPGQFYVSVMDDAIDGAARAHLDAVASWGGPFKRVAGSQSIYIPLQHVSDTVPLIQQALDKFIVSTAVQFTQMGARVEGAHSPGVLSYLREYLEDDLPEPVYGGVIPAVHNQQNTIWKIAPGSDAFLWDFCRQENCLIIGWPGVGNYLSYPSKQAISEKLSQIGNNLGAVQAIWPFAHEIMPGHIVVANKGNNQVVGLGVVTSSYLPPGTPSNPSNNPDYPNARLVDWQVTRPVTLSPAFFGQVPPTVFRVNQGRWSAIKDAYMKSYPEDEVLHRLLKNIGQVTPGQATLELELPPPPLSRDTLRLQHLTEQTRNLLLYGPPGTGKTWQVAQFARAFTEQTKTRFVTFHQSFAYEEFVEGLKPVDDGQGQVLYRVMSGVLRSICKQAQDDPGSRYLLIIDEINRANIAKVLGELITLLEDDKRLGQPNELTVTLPYSGEAFGVPANLYILGTMNTANRSIALLDLALRRRFTFVEMMPNPSLLSADVAGVNLQALLTRLNGRIVALLDQEHQIGHSYLMNVSDVGGLRFAWYHRIVPLLQEYFYHDGERLQAILGRGFVVERRPPAGLFDAGLTIMDTDMSRFEVETFGNDDTAFIAALQQLSSVTESVQTTNPI